MTRWPTANEYNTAVQSPQRCFADPEIKVATPELTALGIPKPRTGAFATVYKMQTPKGDFAIRCFLKPPADQQQRYAAITQKLKAANLPFTVGFRFVDKGILVNGQWYPILCMDWVKGETIYSYIQRNLRDQKRLLSLAQQVVEMLNGLHQNQIAHGDLQNGNILVSNDRLILIDYDGMYVPALNGKPSQELGHRNFQHPLRKNVDYGPQMDNFSGWVIYTSILALALDPNLWNAAGVANSDEQLLFKKDDFDHPQKSMGLRLLTRHPNSKLQTLGSYFQSMLVFDPDQVPSLDGSTINNLPAPTLNPVRSSPVPSPMSTASTPSWLQSHLNNSGAITSSQPAFQRVSQVPGAIPNSPGASNTNLSNWLFDSIAANEPVVYRRFASSLVLPRSLLAISMIACSVGLFMAYLNPVIWVGVLSISAMVFALNIYALIQLHARDAAVLEAKAINAELKIKHQEQTTIQKEVDDVAGKRQSIQDMAAIKLAVLEKDWDKVKGAEDAEILDENQRLGRSISDCNLKRSQLDSAEAKELAELNSSTIGARVTHLHDAIDRSKVAEQNELSGLLGNLQKQHIKSYMIQQYVSSANIPKLGQSLKRDLINYGFRTAADIDYHSVLQVHGIGPTLAQRLENWAAVHRHKADQSKPKVVPNATLNSIKSRYISQRLPLENELSALKPAYAAEEDAIKTKYGYARNDLVQQHNKARIQTDKNISAINQRYKSQYERINNEVDKQNNETKNQLLKIDDERKLAQQRLFVAKMNYAKAQQKQAPYKNLLFAKYVNGVILFKKV